MHLCLLLLYLSLLLLLSICFSFAQKTVQSEKALLIINTNAPSILHPQKKKKEREEKRKKKISEKI